MENYLSRAKKTETCEQIVSKVFKMSRVLFNYIVLNYLLISDGVIYLDQS